MSYAPDCADCPTPNECKAANDCLVLRQIRHGHERKNPAADAKLLADENRWRKVTQSFLENAQAHGLMSDEDLANYVKQNAAWVVEQFIAALPWSESATEHEKALVAGNLRNFWTWLHVNSRGRIAAEIRRREASRQSDDSARLDYLAEVTNLSVLRDMGAMLKGEEAAHLARATEAVYVRFEFHRRFRPTEEAFRLALDDARREYVSNEAPK